MSGDLWRLDATAQAALVRDGEVRPRELVLLAFNRIAKLNPRINAVVTLLAERALATADAPLSEGAPFAGVPMLLKDASIQVAGTPYYVGLGALRDARHRSRHTTELARRLERAGFIFIGKTNVPELSAGITTEPPAFGPARNPWALDRTTSGSSGGSAAAVAAGMTAIAHGADATGSLRYPAAACGVVTLKPTRGLVPATTPTGEAEANRLWAEFVLARSVRDLAGVLDAVADADANRKSYAAALAEPPPPLRIGIMTRDAVAGLPLDPECAGAVRHAGALLASMGHHIEETHPPALDGASVRIGQSIAIIGPAIRAAQLAWAERVLGRALTHGEVSDDAFAARDAAASITPEIRAEAEQRLQDEAPPILSWWREGWDVLLTPVLLQPAWPLGSSGGAMDSGAFPAPFSITGQPAMSLPLAMSASGLPIGVQAIAAPGADALLLRLAAQLEEAAPWRDRWPAVAEA